MRPPFFIALFGRNLRSKVELSISESFVVPSCANYIPTDLPKEFELMEKHAILDLILSDALELYGQPKWTFGKNTCNTYEVFVDKVHLTDGTVIPAWPILELIERDDELTMLFSHWFLSAAMHSAVDLSEKTNSHVTLSINLLPLYANREGYVDEVLTLLDLTGLPASKLQFEVSEAQQLTDRGVENLNILHDQHGVGLLLANFGKGHSNIDLLREVHFDGLELDRSFAQFVPQHEQSCRVIAAIVGFAAALDMYVCAKGIETQEQFEFFEELSCFKGQGFLIGKAMDLRELESYISKYALKKDHH